MLNGHSADCEWCMHWEWFWIVFNDVILVLDRGIGRQDVHIGLVNTRIVECQIKCAEIVLCSIYVVVYGL